jgi:hypothetical protein
MKKLILLIALISLVSLANAQWQQTSLNNVDVYALAIKGDTIFAGTQVSLSDTNIITAISKSVNKNHSGIETSTGRGMYLSTNNGGNWSVVNIGLTDTNVTALAIKGGNIFAGTYDGVYLSSNNGSSWTAVNTGLPAYTYVNALAISLSGDTIFSGSNYSGIYFSANNGSNWYVVNTGLTNTWVNALAISGSNLFAGTRGGGIFLSSNDGGLWSPVDTGLTSTYVWSLAISGNNIFAGTAGGVFVSSNNGSNWSKVNTGLTNTYVNALAISGSYIFAGTDGGIFFSLNNGSNWMNTGLTNDTILALAISSDTLFAGTNRFGVWFLPLITVGIKEINNNVCNVIVYPNPVTEEIQVISNQCSVNSVEICNILGEKIYSLPITDNRSPITINCSSFAKGVYFITLTTVNGKVIKKFVKE